MRFSCRCLVSELFGLARSTTKNRIADGVRPASKVDTQALHLQYAELFEPYGQRKFANNLPIIRIVALAGNNRRQLSGVCGDCAFGYLYSIGHVNRCRRKSDFGTMPLHNIADGKHHSFFYLVVLGPHGGMRKCINKEIH